MASCDILNLFVADGLFKEPSRNTQTILDDNNSSGGFNPAIFVTAQYIFSNKPESIKT